MDQVSKTDAAQWEMKPGGWIEAQYNIPENEWYFKANRSNTLPFCILLEIALQPCGWLAAYAGSALHSDKRLHFRNLGGNALFNQPLLSDSGTITMRSRITDISKAGDMIIQDFDMEVLKDGEIFYKGHTNFGFFTNEALAKQVGIKNNKMNSYLPSKEQLLNSKNYVFHNEAPLTPEDETIDQDNGMPSKALRMIDKIDIIIFDGGIYDKGYIKASKKIDPDEWFFKAHFYQDPVCPGSLGIESFLQIIRFFIFKKWEISPDKYQVEMTKNHEHEWIYRGQIIPSNKNVEIHAHIKKITDEENNRSVIADGSLSVDGICIYEMKNFGATLVPKNTYSSKLGKKQSTTYSNK